MKKAHNKSLRWIFTSRRSVKTSELKRYMALGNSNMKKIIDANCLSDPILDEFLNSDSSNMAVLTEFAGMESFKGDPVKNICQSMSILCNYPKQVIILKGTREIIGENQKPKTINIDLFIDEEQTNGFSETCSVIEQAKIENPRAISPIKKRGELALKEMERLSNDAEKVALGITAISKTFTDSQLKVLRRHEQFPEELISKMTKDILILSALSIRDHPDTDQIPSARELRNSYIFRYSLCCYLLMLDWIEKGGLNNSKAEKLRNDLIDMSYVAYATIFDGILSKDKKLNRIHDAATAFLQTIFI